MDVVIKYMDVVVIIINKNVQIILIRFMIYCMYVYGKVTLVDMEDVKTLIMIVINVTV